MCRLPKCTPIKRRPGDLIVYELLLVHVLFVVAYVFTTGTASGKVLDQARLRCTTCNTFRF